MAVADFGTVSHGMLNHVSRGSGSVADFRIRRATVGDAEAIVTILTRIASERVHSAIERPWTLEQQRNYLASLSSRETFHVAVSGSGEVIGHQSLELWSPLLSSMTHVGQLGTFLLTEWRRRGIGRALFQASESFARSSGYRKFLIQVRSSNTASQRFYQQLGFVPCGRLTRQVVVDGREDDEILMEFFL
jgi:L-amino acid N-acyltransferase YncA